MKVVRSFPYPVREIENVFITMEDGTRLAARIFLPEDAERDPVPAILEYIPYRKRDLTRNRDNINHRYFAGHGYAAVRVDMRGSGDSDGVLTDEYLEQEHLDAEAVIRWIAEQPWCNGSVGMMGISWGGFNSLQVASRRPPELKAIISACSTDDLYVDNMHYMGGCLLGDNLSEATTMFAFNSTPPDPEIVGERWRDMWFDRLHGSGLWKDLWLRHQRRDEYWKPGSICENYGAIQCPVFLVGGWADGYTNAIFRMLKNLEVPRLGLVGPWGHKYPHLGQPGPAIGFLQEALRWWDYWLKGKETGIMDEPMLRAWMQDSVPPTMAYKSRPGRWVAEPEWPSPNVRDREYVLGFRRLAEPDEPREEIPLEVQSPLSVGLFAGKWCSYNAPPDLPHDQREEDGGALVFDTDPLEAPLEILGTPVVDLDLSASGPAAMVAVRLSDVAPNGEATRITYGLLNLTHRNGNAEPEPLEPHRRYQVRVHLNRVAQTFPKGHRLRISISTSYWPLAWPPPKPIRMEIFTGASSVTLPERPPRPEDEAIRPFEEPEGAPPLRYTLLEGEHHSWKVHRDLVSDESVLEVIKDHGVYRIEDVNLEVHSWTGEWYSYVGDDFRSPRGETRTVRRFRRGDWSAEAVTRTVLTCNETDFILYAQLDAYEGDKRVYSQNWDTSIPRDHV